MPDEPPMADIHPSQAGGLDALVERLGGPVVITPPAVLADKDRKGWDLCAQAYILATREHNREVATALSEVSRERDEALQERDEARGDLSGAFQQNAYAAVHALARAEHADAEAASLREELAKAMEALAGIVYYEEWMDRFSDDAVVSTFKRHTFGDLRRARAALNGSGT